MHIRGRWFFFLTTTKQADAEHIEAWKSGKVYMARKPRRKQPAREAETQAGDEFHGGQTIGAGGEE